MTAFIDELFQSMNSQHPNVKLTVETNATTFLGRAFSKNPDGSFTIVFRKPGKLPSFWNSQIPKRYKWNNIQGGLHGAFKIAADFDAQVQTIIRKYLEVGYPIGFIESVINDYKNSKEEEQLIITEWLFDQRKKVLFKLPYCPSNKRDVKGFSNGKSKFIVLWSTRNIKSLFPLKDQVKHLSCVIYEGNFSCGRLYIGETIRNSDILWNEHENTTGKSGLSKHLGGNKLHKFT